MIYVNFPQTTKQLPSSQANGQLGQHQVSIGAPQQHIQPPLPQFPVSMMGENQKVSWLQVSNNKQTPIENAVQTAIAWLASSVDRLCTEGIFRTSGLKVEIDEVSNNASKGIALNYSNYEVETIVGFIKKEFRERHILILPETFTQKQFDDVKTLIHKINDTSPQELRIGAINILKSLLQQQGGLR